MVRSRTADGAIRNLARKNPAFRGELREADEYAKQIDVELVTGADLARIKRIDIE